MWWCTDDVRDTPHTASPDFITVVCSALYSSEKPGGSHIQRLSQIVPTDTPVVA